MREAWLPLAVLLALGLAPLAGFGGSYETTLMARAMILAIAAVSLAFLVGGAGLVSLGHAATVGVGAYAVAILDAHGVTEAARVLPVAIGAAALFSLATGAIAIRTSGVHFIMITLAFGQMAFFTASSLAAYGGDDGYTLYSRTEVLGTRLLEDRLAFHYLCLGLLALTWAASAMLLASRFGRVLRAARENAQRVEAVGLAPYPFRLTGYVIAGAIGGLAGFLLANATEFVSPATLSWQRSGELLFMVILGGVGRLWGAILGALVFVVLETWLAQQMQHWKLVFGPMLILAVLFLRGGLAGVVARRHG
ncbi:branched-chain amino acid ABC transporter permease [Roseomonas alkaliterrae]|uniref:Branched-chain amino acid transport system permease protein n=1 Tax=Neoroseomonas alkaliterrae TaxID=1452450 RepID=A0A840XML4_9PROT|nr:branched-chain amino acid ABC transporter permease [Neoroseomonas alkaliterrae]MBB5689156.1 branched-chain amino acid transport system permease protein [Neoroseomonas alkaliterrae]MBR0675373.1 branched-chain amino acid ABC transporter permease [Neoroseomonas alkaliterrae]